MNRLLLLMASLPYEPPAPRPPDMVRMPVDDEVWFGNKITDTNSGAIPATLVNKKRSVMDPTYGMLEYVPVYNGTGGTLAANAPVSWKTGTTTGEIVASTADDPAVKGAGLLEVALATGYWGWACRYGTHAYTADEAIAADAPLQVGSTAGSMKDTAAAGIEHCLWGCSVAACNDTETGYMRLRLP